MNLVLPSSGDALGWLDGSGVEIRQNSEKRSETCQKPARNLPERILVTL
jgi:hypothetical protein